MPRYMVHVEARQIKIVTLENHWVHWVHCGSTASHRLVFQDLLKNAFRQWDQAAQRAAQMINLWTKHLHHRAEAKAIRNGGADRHTIPRTVSHHCHVVAIWHSFDASLCFSYLKLQLQLFFKSLLLLFHVCAHVPSTPSCFEPHTRKGFVWPKVY